MISIPLARFIDRRIGIAMCTALDYLSRFNRRARRPVALDDVRRVLIIKFWGLGNLVQATPAFRAVRKRFSEAEITYLTLERNRGLFDASPLFDSIIYMRDGSVSDILKGFFPLVKRLRARKFDIVFDMDPIGRFCAIVTFLSGAPVRVGFSTRNQHREQLYTEVVPLNEEQHVRRIFLGLPERLGLDVSDDSLERITPPEHAVRKVDELLKNNGIPAGAKLAIINVNASEVAYERRWPIERFAEVADKLAINESVAVAFVGAPGEVEYVGRAAAMMKNRFWNFAGATSLAEMVELIGRAALFISNDSGPMHVAAAMGVPVIGLFGPETPKRYSPDRDKSTVFFASLSCSPCISFNNEKQVNCHRNAECMTRITVDEVYGAAVSLLGV